ncbi:MAG: hypothetical protein OWU84_15165 [Firmicutes bacterium]|nr:hypothetical protein [Bacillota bacterium]
MELDRNEMDQYSRQMLVDEIGYEGQLAILSTLVRVWGPEPWRQWASRYLTAMGFSVEESPGEKFGVALGDHWRWTTQLSSDGDGMRELGLGLSRLICDWLGQVTEGGHGTCEYDSFK